MKFTYHNMHAELRKRRWFDLAGQQELAKRVRLAYLGLVLALLAMLMLPLAAQHPVSAESPSRDAAPAGPAPAGAAWSPTAPPVEAAPPILSDGAAIAPLVVPAESIDEAVSAPVQVSPPRPQIELLAQGWAAHYAPSVMEGVVQRRQQGETTIDLPPFDPGRYTGYAARPDCSEVGQEIWIDFGAGWTGPFLVVDCARVEDRWHIESRGIVVEVGYATATRFGVAETGGLPVRIGRAAASAPSSSLH